MKNNRIACFNNLLLILIFLLFSVSAMSCSSGTENQKTEGQIQSNAESLATSENIVVPRERPDLIGKVKDIVGNEVTVYKVEIAEATEQKSQENSQKPVANKTNQNSQDLSRATRPIGLKVTEETETFIIPVGTPIVTMQRGTNEIKTVALTEIKKDQLLRVWKKDDTVIFVQVMSGSSERSMSQNGEATDRKGGAKGPPGGPPLGLPLGGPR
ncbi:MAG: Uncharacterized protein XD63_1712 [Thermoanaerobacterales bacterium 50_218]|nr:MAG: Uncharacterized protein XD63_1712 [Thermoanaerobacterales bacterium 50_218]HAA90389.1 hypothetical protein [Peptococcaceae bacterium]